MSLFFKPSAAESRAISDLPWSHGGDSPTSKSLEGSLALVPVYAAVRLLADSVATLPLQAFRKAGDTRTPITLPPLFAEPSNHGTRVDWLQRCMTSLLLRGNAYGLKVGAEAGSPRMIEWLHPDRVTFLDGTWTYMGREVPAVDMVHIPATVLPGSRIGVSPLAAARAMIQSGESTQTFMRDWYLGRAIPSLIAKNSDKTLDASKSAVVKERLMSTMRAGEPFVTGKDWDITIMKLSADDAGFITSAKLTATQVAALYGVPPEMIGGEAGGSLTYSTLEQNQINYVTYSLQPWLVRLETAFSALLPRPQYVKFNIDALIRPDTKARHEVAQIARTIGLASVNELRAREDMPPIDGGDNPTPLSQMGPARAKEAR